MDKNLYTLSEISLYSTKRNDGNSLQNINSFNSDTKLPSEETAVQEKSLMSNLDGNLLIPDTGSEEGCSYSSMDAEAEESEKTLPVMNCPPFLARFFSLFFFSFFPA